MCQFQWLVDVAVDLHVHVKAGCHPVAMMMLLIRGWSLSGMVGTPVPREPTSTHLLSFGIIGGVLRSSDQVTSHTMDMVS